MLCVVFCCEVIVTRDILAQGFSNAY